MLFTACNAGWFIYVLYDFIIVLFNNHNNMFYLMGWGKVRDEDLWIWPAATGKPLELFHAVQEVEAEK